MVTLDRLLVVKLFAYLCQAQRSLHRAMCNEWSNFQAYYRPARAAGVRELIHALDAALPGLRRGGVPDKDKICKGLPNVGPIRFYLGGWFTRGKRAFAFKKEEIVYIAYKLEALLGMLARPSKPTIAELVDQRLDLSIGEGILESRCFGLDEFKRARYIEHFDRTEWFPHAQLWEILGEPAPQESKGAAKAAS